MPPSTPPPPPPPSPNPQPHAESEAQRAEGSGTPTTQTTPAVIANQLTLIRNGTRILDNLSCTLPRNQITALLGPNGCGKTTFARCITGQLYPTTGKVTVLDQTLGRTSVPDLRKRLAVINPAANDIVQTSLSALDAVCTGFFHTAGLYDKPTPDQRDRAAHLLQSVGLAHRLDHAIATLSTGEQRRMMIARALTNVPELLILDEVTAGLDIAGREQILATLEQLYSRPNAPTVLMITHHVEELSPKTQQVLLMRHGQLLATGHPQDTINPESLSQTFGCKVYVKQTHGRYWLEVLPEAWLDLL